VDQIITVEGSCLKWLFLADFLFMNVCDIKRTCVYLFVWLAVCLRESGWWSSFWCSEAISSGSNLSVPIGVPDCSWTLTDPEPHMHAYIHIYIRAYVHIRVYVYEQMYIFTYLRTYARTHTNEFDSGI